MAKKDIYSQLGVSSKKEDVHEAIKDIDKGLFPGAFCKIIDDIAGRQEYCSVFHADGAGTKSSLAYMYYKETNDISVFRGIVHDAMVMNIDDMLCVGTRGPIFFSNNIGRNSHYITGEIIASIINEYHRFSQKLTEFGLEVVMCGGETADVGDLVKTLIVDASAFATLKKSNVIDASQIQNRDVILGLASSGKSSYEEKYNSGIGSNGLTLGRHGTLHHEYYEKYPECYDHSLKEDLVFFGKYGLTDRLKTADLSVGEALLSPTRTYTPILLEVLQKFGDVIHGIIHNTGGGQTKALHFGRGIHYIKDNFLELPELFKMIQASSQTPWKEMYQVFNMGHRMEIYCNESIANQIIKIAQKYNIEAKIIGQCEKASKSSYNELTIDSEYGKFLFQGN